MSPLLLYSCTRASHARAERGVGVDPTTWSAGPLATLNRSEPGHTILALVRAYPLLWKVIFGHLLNRRRPHRYAPRRDHRQSRQSGLEGVFRHVHFATFSEARQARRPLPLAAPPTWRSPRFARADRAARVAQARRRERTGGEQTDVRAGGSLCRRPRPRIGRAERV